MQELICEILVDNLYPYFENLSESQINQVMGTEEFITEVKAVKQKVVRDLMLTVKYGQCPEGYKVDSKTKQCVKMSTAEKKLMHKIAKRAAKSFKSKGTAAKLIKKNKFDKSMTMRKRLGLFDWKDFNATEKAASRFNK